MLRNESAAARLSTVRRADRATTSGSLRVLVIHAEYDGRWATDLGFNF